MKVGKTKIAVGFGEESGTGDIPEKINPIYDGITTGAPSCDGVFILRNPENCCVIDYSLKGVPIYLEKKIKTNYETCYSFWKLDKNPDIKEYLSGETIQIKDLKITSYLINPSNMNTHILKVTDGEGKTVVVTGDFKNYDGNYSKDKLNQAILDISKADCVFVEGKYLGKIGIENSSGKDIFDNLKNIVKFYKQVFIIQSETDLNMAENIYQVALKTKKIFIESTLLCNLSTLANGSCPSPFLSKKVYSYNPLLVENNDFEFKKKYVTPFYISSALSKLKKEKYVMNITKDMLQDMQLFEKDGSFYDACVILAEWKGFVKKDPELEEFIGELKNFDMDYYELYTHGKVNLDVLKDLISKIKPRYVIPLDFSNERGAENLLNNFKILNDEKLEI